MSVSVALPPSRLPHMYTYIHGIIVFQFFFFFFSSLLYIFLVHFMVHVVLPSLQRYNVSSHFASSSCTASVPGAGHTSTGDPRGATVSESLLYKMPSARA